MADNENYEITSVPGSKLFSEVKFQDDSVELCSGLKKNLLEFMKLEYMTMIQAKAFPSLLAGRDVLLKAETGSGKTLAFALPIVEKIFQDSLKVKIDRSIGTIAIFLAPTRELCLQIDRVVRQLCTPFPWLVTGSIMGGEKPAKEKKRLRKGVNMLICTPGRLEYHLKHTKNFKVDTLKYIVMDEADRLLDMKFGPQLQTIYTELKKRDLVTKKKKPQTVLVSATLTNQVRKLAEWTLKDEVFVGVGTTEMRESTSESQAFSIPDSLKQYFMCVPCKLRLPTLVSFIVEHTHPDSLKIKKLEQAAKMLIFFSSCSSVDFHYNLFTSTQVKKKKMIDGKQVYKREKLINVPLFKLHGDMSQQKRLKVYNQFLKSPEGILLCTDIVARGLDIPKMDWIVQYDPPSDPKEYLHRIGRTSRAGFHGNSMIMLMPHEKLYIDLLAKFKLKLNEINAESQLEYLKMVFNQRDVFQMAAAVRNQFESVVESSPKLEQQALIAYQNFVKAYSTHSKGTRFIFNIKNLHLGHVAASFSLKKSPSELKKNNSQPKVVKEFRDQGFKVSLKKTPNIREKELRIMNEVAGRSFEPMHEKKEFQEAKVKSKEALFKQQTQRTYNGPCARPGGRLSANEKVERFKNYSSGMNMKRPKIDLKSYLKAQDANNLSKSQRIANAASFNFLEKKPILGKRKRKESPLRQRKE